MAHTMEFMLKQSSPSEAAINVCIAAAELRVNPIVWAILFLREEI